MKDLAKKIAVHLAIMMAMCLGLYLGKDSFSIIKAEPLRLLAAMAFGAYATKPLADWVWRKIQ